MICLCQELTKIAVWGYKTLNVVLSANCAYKKNNAFLIIKNCTAADLIWTFKKSPKYERDFNARSLVPTLQPFVEKKVKSCMLTVVALSWNMVTIQGHWKSRIHLYTHRETFGWVWARLDQGERRYCLNKP